MKCIEYTLGNLHTPYGSVTIKKTRHDTQTLKEFLMAELRGTEGLSLHFLRLTGKHMLRNGWVRGWVVWGKGGASRLSLNNV